MTSKFYTCLVALLIVALTEGAFSASLADSVPAGPNLIPDPTFKRGFAVAAPTAESSTGAKMYDEAPRLSPFGDPSGPTWKLAQWNSRLSVPTQYRLISSGAAIWQNEAKTVEIGLPGSPEEGLGLTVNSDFEGGSLEGRKRAWPNLFFEEPFGPVQFSSIRTLLFTAQFKLTALRMRPDPNKPGVAQAAHYLITFTIHGRPKEDILWLQLQVVDSRSAHLRRFTMLDHDKHRFGLVLGMPDNYLVGDPRSGEWVDINVDLLKKAHEAIEEGFRQRLLSSNNIDDYRMTNITIGWEVPGFGVAGGTIRRLQLSAM